MTMTLRGGVFAQVLEHVGLVDVGAIADRRQLAEGDVLGGRPVHQDVAEDAALGHDRDASGPDGVEIHLAGGETARHIHHAHTVGTDDADARFPGQSPHLFLRLRPLGTHLGEARALDVDDLDALLDAVSENPRDCRRGNDDDGQIDIDGHVLHRRIDREPLDLLLPRVDQVQALGSDSDVEEKPGEAGTEAESAFLRADDGDAPRLVEHVDGVSLAHRDSLFEPGSRAI